MAVARAFRLSFYVSLGIACACLFYGEWDFLPWSAALVPVLFGFLVLAYRVEGKWQLGAEGANRFGLVILFGTLAWIYIKVPRTPEDFLAAGVPWPAALLPLLAPLLPILLLVKVFRPKTLLDFWAFQAISLIIVTLSCILAADVWFFAMLGVYLASLLWCMALYFLHRQKRQAEKPAAAILDQPLFEQPELSRPVFAANARAGLDKVPWPYLGVTRAFRWTLPVLACGLLLFFLMPRVSNLQWVPAKLAVGAPLSLRSGFEGGIDLNREGVLELSSEPAFELTAVDVNGPTQLPLDQRWQMQVLDNYEKGRWLPWTQSRFRANDLNSVPLPSWEHVIEDVVKDPDQAPFDLAAGEIYLSYRIRAQVAGGLPLAEPLVAFDKVGLHPHDAEYPSRWEFFRLVPESDSFFTKVAAKRFLLRYGQVFTPQQGGGDHRAHDVSPRYVDYLANQSAPKGLVAWTRELLKDLPELSRAQRRLDGGHRLPAEHHEPVARALCSYLAHSGYYTYSLKLTRVDHQLDPTEDFLFNVKEGHCERYAAALTLMLRSLRIPARVVKGFHGVETLENGAHMVRQNQAHSWVQALIRTDDEAGSWKWIVLDPTPAESAADSALLPWFDWIWTRLQNPSFLWKNLVMEYNTDRQAESVGQLWHAAVDIASPDHLANAWHQGRAPLGALALASLSVWSWRRWGRRQRLATRTTLPPLRFHRRLLKVLAQYCDLAPQPGQTPLEFAHQAETALTWRPLTATLRQVPAQAVELLYRLRFGGHDATPGECDRLEARIADLEAELRQMPA